MADESNGSGNSEAQGVQKQIDATIEKIEKQEEKVAEAGTAAQAEKEQGKLDSLIEKFDALTERLDKIDKRLEEPTVPAPEAKQETPVETPTPEVKTEETTDGAETKPKKRRLGAWG